MKKTLLLAFVAILAIGLAGCSKNDNPGPNDPAYLINILSQGTWRITYFMDAGTNKTTNFTGYNFTFTTAAVLLAEKGTTHYTGLWSALSQNGQLELIVSFTSPAAFIELGNTWHVVDATGTKVILSAVVSGGTDYLTFEQN
jgi:hypothetical protein